jgi:hypothetical protein
MSDQDPTHGDDASHDDATPTQVPPTEPAPSPDSIYGPLVRTSSSAFIRRGPQ